MILDIYYTELRVVKCYSDSNEGTRFAIALPPAVTEERHAELIINVRQTTEVTVTTSSTSEVVTVYGNWSYRYDFPYSMRTINGVEEKGGCYFSFITENRKSKCLINKSIGAASMFYTIAQLNTSYIVHLAVIVPVIHLGPEVKTKLKSTCLPFKYLVVTCLCMLSNYRNFSGIR